VCALFILNLFRIPTTNKKNSNKKPKTNPGSSVRLLWPSQVPRQPALSTSDNLFKKVPIMQSSADWYPAPDLPFFGERGTPIYELFAGKKQALPSKNTNMGNKRKASYMTSATAALNIAPHAHSKHHDKLITLKPRTVGFEGVASDGVVKGGAGEPLQEESSEGFNWAGGTVDSQLSVLGVGSLTPAALPPCTPLTAPNNPADTPDMNAHTTPCWPPRPCAVPISAPRLVPESGTSTTVAGAVSDQEFMNVLLEEDQHHVMQQLRDTCQPPQQQEFHPSRSTSQQSSTYQAMTAYSAPRAAWPGSDKPPPKHSNTDNRITSKSSNNFTTSSTQSRTQSPHLNAV
jgi:hypothetical protein